MGAKLVYTCDYQGCKVTSEPPDTMKIIHMDCRDYYVCNEHYKIISELFERK